MPGTGLGIAGVQKQGMSSDDFLRLGMELQAERDKLNMMKKQTQDAAIKSKIERRQKSLQTMLDFHKYSAEFTAKGKAANMDDKAIMAHLSDARNIVMKQVFPDADTTDFSLNTLKKITERIKPTPQQRKTRTEANILDQFAGEMRGREVEEGGWNPNIPASGGGDSRSNAIAGQPTEQPSDMVNPQNRIAALGGETDMPETSPQTGSPYQVEGGTIGGIQFKRKQTPEELTKAIELPATKEMAKQRKQAESNLNIVKGKMKTMAGAFKAMSKFSGGAGRLHGIKNVWEGQVTGQNPYVVPFSGLVVEVATSIAKLAAPSARVGRHLIEAFSKTIPTQWSTDDEMYNQLRFSLHNAIDSAAGNILDDTERGSFARNAKFQADSIIVEMMTAKPLELDNLKAWANQYDTMQSTGKILIVDPNGEKGTISQEKLQEALWDGCQIYTPTMEEGK